MRQTENVVLGSKHKGYIEVNGRDVFAEGFVFALFVSFPGSVCVRVCVSAYMCSTCSARSLPLPPLTCEVEEDDYIPRGQLYLHGDPRRNTNIRNMLRIPPHYLQLQAREERGDRQTAGVDAMRCN